MILGFLHFEFKFDKLNLERNTYYLDGRIAMEDDWSNYLRNLKGDIFEMIKRAIMVAASDHPQDIQNRRDMIAQTLFSCDLLKCSGCEKQSVNVGGTETEDEATTVSEVLRMKQILENNINESEAVLMESLSNLQQMNGDAWIKDTKKMHQEKQILPTSNQKRPVNVRIKMKKDPVKDNVPEQKVENNNNDEVLRMKRILDDESVSESVVMESLKRLQNIRMSVKTLEATGIGRSVSVLQKRGSKDVRQIAWALVKKWKGIVDDTERKINSEKVEEKFKATKRKLHEAYEEAEKMRRKRIIQVIQLHELTKKVFSFPK
ncbi:hypothetical protein L1987_70838 [Smallanthus sonchifolius]|uniref:Uncharacterized protein n=1 Tax=Smallanthus sonchifolius TaxID=185202 RepID=A0ACB9AR03_9ASTR|nr:hypothetical protein L1987_70838 [Smallanthus sonchifolius]